MEQAGRIAIPERHAWLSACALLLTSWIALAALFLHVRPDAEVVAVAFPPWWGMHDVFEAAASADAAIIRLTSLPSVLVVRPDDHDGLARLRAAGAWLTIDPQAVAACFTK